MTYLGASLAAKDLRMDERLLITIDGPTASGKTSLAHALAPHLGMCVLDTGLTFRAVAYATLREPVSPGGHLFEVLWHEVAPPTTRPVTSAVVYHGEDVTDAIWSSEVDQQVRTIAADPAWRRDITEHHRTIISGQSRVIAVGRDCAMTITEADYHVFLTAIDTIRRERRRAQSWRRPGRVVEVGSATALDETAHAYISRQPRSLILETTHLPPEAAVRAVLHLLGDCR